MQASNNSPLLKGSQKTKGTIWKPLIAISSLSIFSFISGQYLPYVIVAVSGSGAIAAVPLAIFAVSTVVALISTIYLIRLAVSRADSKKEAGLDGEEFGHIASQEPQKFVCENCTSLESKPIGEEPNKTVKQDSESQTEVEDKSNVSTPTPPPVTFETQPSVSAPPPPPPEPTPNQLNQASVAAQKNSANTTGEKSPAGTTQKSTTTGKFTPPGGGKRPKDLIAELSEKLKSRRKGISGKQEDDVQQPNNLTGVFSKMSDRIPPPRSRSDSVSSDSSNVSDDEWDTDQEPLSSPGSQLLHRERSESPDSGYGDNAGSRAISPVHPEQKTEESPSSRVDLSSAAQVNNVNPVDNKVQDPSTSSIKDRRKFFDSIGGVPNSSK